MHPKREKAIALRQQGLSFSEIGRKTGISKSTLSYMLRNTQLTAEQKERLDTKSRLNRDTFRQLCAGQRQTGSKVWSRKGGKACWERNREQSLKNLSRRGFAQTELEKRIALKLERIFGLPFRKELVGGHYFDFASSAHLIEHSLDSGKGLRDIISRFSDVQDDPREKIAYVNFDHLGRKRVDELAALVDDIRDCREVLEV